MPILVVDKPLPKTPTPEEDHKNYEPIKDAVGKKKRFSIDVIGTRNGPSGKSNEKPNCNGSIKKSRPSLDLRKGANGSSQNTLPDENKTLQKRASLKDRVVSKLATRKHGKAVDTRPSSRMDRSELERTQNLAEIASVKDNIKEEEAMQWSKIREPGGNPPSLTLDLDNKVLPSLPSLDVESEEEELITPTAPKKFGVDFPPRAGSIFEEEVSRGRSKSTRGIVDKTDSLLQSNPLSSTTSISDDSSHYSLSTATPFRSSVSSTLSVDDLRDISDMAVMAARTTATSRPMSQDEIASPVSAPIIPINNSNDTESPSAVPVVQIQVPKPSKWSALRTGVRLGRLAKKNKDNIPTKEKTGADIVTELFTGLLPVHCIGMHILRDERGNRRVPVMLSQLQLKITDSDIHSRTRAKFRIELEYGDGIRKWVVEKQYRDFVSLNARLRLSDPAGTLLNNFPKLPKLHSHHLRRSWSPSSGLLRRGSFMDSNAVMRSPENSTQDLPSLVPHSPASDHDMTVRGDLLSLFRLSQHIPHSSQQNLSSQVHLPSEQAHHAREIREKLEKYLLDLIRYLLFRPEASKLCKFLELSAIGLEIAPKGGYQGKEGYLYLQMESVLPKWVAGPLRINEEGKWFLVRHNYVLYVSHPAENAIKDVILVDSKFDVMEDNFFVPTQHTSKAANLPRQHFLTITNSERTLRLRAKHEFEMDQFLASLENLKQSEWAARSKRFDSFAPVRKYAAAEWLVDGRDYMWRVSRAIAMAKESIYIEDWFLSPEIYLRRPATKFPEWRLDRLLKRKAEQGVKIFVVLYREIAKATPLFSSHAKEVLLGLHKNVHVQRHPFGTNRRTYYYAHHEKLVVVDNVIAFIGGLDLCFGRWDSPQHVMEDDRIPGQDDINNDNPQIWLGKDYSNTRRCEFYGLNKPFEDSIDRSKIPRMPWHDVAMMLVGQPARDVGRHFIQRWNFLRRSRQDRDNYPFLLPPPDFKQIDLDRLGLTGTCEVQILRSVSDWSMGVKETEQSIHKAYIRCIERAEKFIYIENQFFITSTIVEGVRIDNGIGEAIVARIIRARLRNEKFRIVLVMPLLPDFCSAVEANSGTPLRRILYFQYMSICRGEHSIYGRLQKEGINPDDYFTIYGLRQWDKLGGQYVTEQVYVHTKLMIVDDRTVIIGSANINERSLRGDRDSEIAAIVRDTDQIDSYMNGKPFKVGRFAYTLRKRLMMEHLGLDVDSLGEELARVYTPQEDSDSETSEERGRSRPSSAASKESNSQEDRKEKRRTRRYSLKMDNVFGDNNPAPILYTSRATTVAVPTRGGNRDRSVSNSRSRSRTRGGEKANLPRLLKHFKNYDTYDDPLPDITPDKFTDPLIDTFFIEVWQRTANHNTDVFRKVFKPVPDDNVTNWKLYKEFLQLSEMGNLNISSPASDQVDSRYAPTRTSTVNGENVSLPPITRSATQPIPGTVESSSENSTGIPVDEVNHAPIERQLTFSSITSRHPLHANAGVMSLNQDEERILEHELSEIRGHLVVYPTRFLCENTDELVTEKDKLFPLQIFA
ncbi:uncharacterized protein VTP21DRAFT_2559 [Calcarisporiella thermophila]|uniref:uncharacterized protein n=1 Tax=Calcarisporiella thermophila TaxID=911321 RepID=UPI0037438175